MRAEDSMLVIQAYRGGLSGVHAGNPDVKLSISDPELAGEPVLRVDYPAPTEDPAGRDVRCTAENRDWTAGRAVSFRIRPVQALRMSVSFLDRNRVAYTTWLDLIAFAPQDRSAGQLSISAFVVTA
jgi:hypothetical protein